MFLAYVVSSVALISALALSFLGASTTSYRLSRNALEVMKYQTVVDAAVVRAVLGLLDARPGRRWRVDGASQDFAFGNVKMRIAIQDELGRIDLNHADRSLLVGLFQSVGLGLDASGGLADKILDWREAGASKRPNGASKPDYRTAGLRQGPRNGPFQSVDEVKLVLDMTPELYRRVEPALTVYSGRPRFDPQFAPAEALAALPARSRDTAAVIVASRPSQGARAGTIDPAISLWGRAFAIRVEVERSEAYLTREVVIRLTDQPSRPYWLLNWRGR